MMQKLYRALGLFLAMLIVIPASLAFLPAASAYEWGVDSAMAPSGDWEPLAAGDSHWYVFQYAGDGSQVTVRLQAVPGGSAPSSDGVGFVVWTPELIDRWALGQSVEPIGRGSADPAAEGVLTWSGSFTTTGSYYVVVEQAGGQAGTSYYLLEIEGDGVSITAPAPEDPAAPPATTPSTSSPAKPRPKSRLASKLEGKLVFQTTYGGPFYTIDVGGDNLQRVTNGIDPAWSPDGEQIAFVRWEEPRGVWVIDAGGSERRVFDWIETRHPCWSPEGEEILFSRQYGGSEGRTRCFWGRCFTMPGSKHWRLGIVSLGDRAFAEPAAEKKVARAPDWSPDGQQFVYQGERGLVVEGADGSARHQLTTDARDTSPVWSPDGTRVAFVRRQHDHWEVYVLDLATGQQARLTDTPAVNGVAANSVSPAWSPDGAYLAFLTDRSGRWEIWVMGADGSKQGLLFGTELDGLTLDYAFAGERAIDWSR